MLGAHLGEQDAACQDTSILELEKRGRELGLSHIRDVWMHSAKETSRRPIASRSQCEEAIVASTSESLAVRGLDHELSFSMTVCADL
jgi:hypothetical protein